jgi:hypothetical protein
LVELGEFTGHHPNDRFGMEPFVAEARRNALKAVWLLAGVCRAARKAAIARLMEGDADRGIQSSPVVATQDGKHTQPAARRPQPAQAPKADGPQRVLGKVEQRAKNVGFHRTPRD